MKKNHSITLIEMTRFIQAGIWANTKHWTWWRMKKDWTPENVFPLLEREGCVELIFNSKGEFIEAKNKLEIPIDEKFIEKFLWKYDAKLCKPIKLNRPKKSV